MKLIPVMGLEIHAELLTKSKVFCSCENSFGGEPNTRVCPVCSGMPGTLPILNKNAVTLAVKAGLCLGCRINEYSAFDRKNYFYPDLPKAYQITQYEYPICSDGLVDIGDKKIRINRIHIEEDAGKLIHDSKNNISLIDFNRCGVPLIEIVTEPDFTSAEEVCRFVEEISLRLKYAGVCDARLEQGSIRVDVNISVMEENSEELGTRAEIKNLNSFKSIMSAVEYEIKRQSRVLEKGERVVQETRRYNESSGTTISMRKKEESRDYRYFPEPDILPIRIENDTVEEIKSTLPEMPYARIKRYTQEYKIPQNDAELIVKDKEFSDFFEEAVKFTEYKKTCANLMLGELNRNLNSSETTLSQLRFTPKMLAELAELINSGKVTPNAAKDILKIMFETGENPKQIADKNNLILKDNKEDIIKAVKNLLKREKDNVKSYRNGKTQLLGYFTGQVIREAGRGTDPKLVKEILTDALEADGV